jgi:hypothetical protein
MWLSNKDERVRWAIPPVRVGRTVRRGRPDEMMLRIPTGGTGVVAECPRCGQLSELRWEALAVLNGCSFVLPEDEEDEARADRRRRYGMFAPGPGEGKGRPSLEYIAHPADITIDPDYY